MKVYLAGPMRGIEDLNRPKFAAYSEQLRADGNEVFNPAAANLEGMPLGRIMAYVLCWLCEEAEAIALIPGWRKSGGAVIEFMVAKYLGLRIVFLK